MKLDDPESKEVVDFLEGDANADNYISNHDNFSSPAARLANKYRETRDDVGLTAYSRDLHDKDGVPNVEGGSWVVFDAYRWSAGFSSAQYNNYEVPWDNTLKMGDYFDVRHGDTEVFNRFAHPRVHLAHELYHSWDRANGGVSQERYTYDTGHTQRICEFDAVKFENLIRKATGKPMRTRYGGVVIPVQYLK